MEKLRIHMNLMMVSNWFLADGVIVDGNMSKKTQQNTNFSQAPTE